MPLAYIAEPIDFRNAGPEQLQFTQRIDGLRRKGWVLYRPAHAFEIQGGTKPGPAVYNINQQALAAADLVIALVDGHSIGVPAEIQTALDNNTVVDCYTSAEIAAKSWQLAGWNQYDHFDLNAAPELEEV